MSDCEDSAGCGMDAGLDEGSSEYDDTGMDTGGQEWQDAIDKRRRELQQRAQQLQNMNAIQRQAYQRDVQALQNKQAELQKKQAQLMAKTKVGMKPPKVAAAESRANQLKARQLQQQKMIRDRQMQAQEMQGRFMQHMNDVTQQGLNAHEYAMQWMDQQEYYSLLDNGESL